MTFSDDDIKHKGLKKFWKSGGSNVSGINPNWASNLKFALVHLYTAQCIEDLQNPEPKNWKFHKHVNTRARYSINVTKNYRLLFNLTDPETGAVTDIDLADPH